MTCPSCHAATPPNTRFCGMCGAPLARQPVERERRRVSMVFIDLAGFTTLTHGFDPEELRDLADEILTVIAGIIEDYDGHVDAFQGDGLTALFGAPRSHPDDPKRAVLAAAAGLRAIEAIGRSKGYTLRGRAGVNTGVVIAGSVGLGRVKDYTVMGSAVNLAARLEAAATPGSVLVGAETYEATRHALRFAESPPLKLAGFPDVTRAFELVSTDYPAQTDPNAGLAFVGRARELSRLKEAYAQVSALRRPQQLWLVGEAGSGKTRLLREFVDALPAPEALSLETLSLETLSPETLLPETLTPETFLPEASSPEASSSEPDQRALVWLREQPALDGRSPQWTQLAEQLFGLLPAEDEHLKRQRALAYFKALGGEGDATWQKSILDSLGLVERDRRKGSRPRAHGTYALAWVRLLRSVASSGASPLVVVADTHSSNPGLEEFFDGLLRSRAPVLVLRTNRTREGAAQTPSQVQAPSQTLTLAPLSLGESQALLEQVASPLLAPATRSLVTQAGGVPAYILELGRALSITPTGSFSGSLTSLLQARLDMLPPPSRRLLAYVASTGERCWEGLAIHLANGQFAGGDGRAALDALVEAGLLTEDGASSLPSEVEYRFQSELLRSAAERLVPYGDRGALHRRVALWLEQRAPLELSKLIGFHFERAGMLEAAYPHYLAAADSAVTARNPEVAFEIFEHLLALDLSPALKAQGGLAYAQAALGAGDLTRAHALLDAARGGLEHLPETAGELKSVYEKLREETSRLLALT